MMSGSASNTISPTGQHVADRKLIPYERYGMQSFTFCELAVPGVISHRTFRLGKQSTIIFDVGA